jgi:OOP family OmpA-OmpF porin
MRNFFTAFIIFMAWFGLIYLYISFDFKASINSFFAGNQKSEILVQNIIEDKSEGFSENKNALLQVFDKNNELLFSLDTIYFKKNNESVIINPLLQDYFSKLTDYISQNNKSIEIISHYSAEENYSSPNLGIKRGKSLEKLLVEAGVRINEIKVKAVMSNIEFDSDNRSYGKLQLILRAHIYQPDTTTLDELNTNVYPEFTFARINVNDELRGYGKKLKEYLNQNPNRNVLIIGHTDNVGSHADTHELGLKYARQVRAYLINTHRIEAVRLVAMSLGKESPIADNTTDEGRKKNLRIEFKVE